MTPFARISTRVFDHMADLGPSGLAVYAGLAKYADNLTRACFPRQGTLAKLLHLPRQSVNTAILRLESLGLIEVERRAGRGHVYRLLDAEPATVGFAPRPCGANAEQSAAAQPLPEPVERPPLSAQATTLTIFI